MAQFESAVSLSLPLASELVPTTATLKDLLPHEMKCIANFWEYHLSSSLWRSLCIRTQEFLKQFLLQYRLAESQPEDFADFASSLLQFSNALLVEINTRFWRPVRNDAAARNEARLFNQHLAGKIEWAEFCRLIQAVNETRLPEIARVALSHRVRPMDLLPLIPYMEEIRILARSKNPHAERIDRREAAALYDRFLNQCLARRILLALHGEVRQTLSVASDSVR